MKIESMSSIIGAFGVIGIFKNLHYTTQAGQIALYISYVLIFTSILISTIIFANKIRKQKMEKKDKFINLNYM